MTFKEDHMSQDTNNFVPVEIYAPRKMILYAKTLAYSIQVTFKQLFNDSVEHFLTEKPWERGFKWRPNDTQSTDWSPIKTEMDVDLYKKFEKLSREQDVSLNSATYSSLYWLTWHVCPPASERLKREAAGKPLLELPSYLKNPRYEPQPKKSKFELKVVVDNTVDHSIQPVTDESEKHEKKSADVIFLYNETDDKETSTSEDHTIRPDF